MTDLTTKLVKESLDKFDKEFPNLWEFGDDGERVGWIGNDHGCWSNSKPRIKDFITKLISQAVSESREEILKQIDPFDLVEPCNPDCTPEEHAYHQGTWDSQLKLEKIIEKLLSPSQ